ncbi:DNA-binding response regulator, NarL/FixJ family, contains REC and HTH domains [Solimonas aquatica]|uniref:DNA-binding response regulator, NarL/FixJ family, contains REC and HTH domains n=1 Tax=Solimonas aquatica TaxID=489703 RepID=A0A1H9CVD6_9GAMM|nr:response regulator transcription factor [Solimonas aquatica]SEQ05182.1 DNA-binding response regulator, NarL/FixJ family, contains REC and HTH domains [Solimonas aquatica]
MNPIRLLLADDHTIVRQGLVSMLEETGECQVVAQAADGFEALSLALKTTPEVVVTDISMPRMSGLELVKRLRAELPGTRTLVLTVHEEDEYILPILRAGANGFLNKDTSVSDLMTAIKAIHAGRSYFGPRATKALAERQHRSRDHGDDPYASLTAREREAFHLVIQGKTTKEIAQILDIGVKTAENHRARMMEKLGLRNTAEVVRFAALRGLLT